MKKKIVFIMMICLVVFSATPVFAANIASCDSTISGAIIDEKVPKLVSTAITIIKIVVPILLVVFGMLDLMKGITAQKEDEIKKGQQLFIKRLISGALVFLVFTIVQFIVSFVADEDDKTDIMTCAQCFLNGDCTYRFKDEKNKVCPSDKKLNKEKTACVDK